MEALIAMSYAGTELACWNVCGLNGPARRKALREFVDSLHVAIYCILETKLERVGQYMILQCMGPTYDGYTYLPMSDTREGFSLLGTPPGCN